ncbi:MAG: butyrate kinase [Candidatus Eisenbacteria bacterium]
MSDERLIRVVALNPGSTSTKFGAFENDTPLFQETVRHSEEELVPYDGRPLTDQLDFRMERVRAALDAKGLPAAGLDAVVGRGGLLKPLPSGTFEVNDRMLADLREARRGDHASNLGAPMAADLAAGSKGARAFIVDPVSVDEWEPVARLSGLAGLDRECLSHALNTKAVAKRFARETGRPYAELRLVIAHLGSGTSVSAHENGRMVDVTNSRDEGAFSTERSGTVPVMKLIDLCLSGEVTRKEMGDRIFRRGGMVSYLGTKDLPAVLGRIRNGDEKAKLVFDAMIYQIGKEIGAYATVLRGKVNGILLTGGMVHEDAVVSALKERIDWIAPVHAFPGEDELQALAEGALRVLRGEEHAIEYV